MPAPGTPSLPRATAGLDEFLQRALLLDLEVSPQGRIRRLGAALGTETLANSGDHLRAIASDPLARLTAAATCVLGHNLVRHDLPALRQVAPRHPLLRLPVIDTLVLSPICFPENPYHRLVKDYKLVRESLNDPVADARQAGVLFRDEFAALDGLRQTEPQLFALLHFLLATADTDDDPLAAGMKLLFQSLATPLRSPPTSPGSDQPQRPAGFSPPQRPSAIAHQDHPQAEHGEPASQASLPSPATALTVCRALFARWACASVPADEGLIRTASDRHALACTLAWLRVAGANSVLPPWVRLGFPQTGALIHRLREVPCASSDCAYCRRVHNARAQLRQFFQYDDFRPSPPNAEGGSLQQDIVEAGLRDESLLAILPTSGGKSLCFQLPALVRNYRRGVLTLVISPLQALMKDQVDGLVRRTGTPFAAALYGLLTPPERGDVLRRIRMGDVALLYVSPEQLRNRSFREAITQREIGCWVFDEAHCLSKWGHDFRPDYLYAGRFIREFSARTGGPVPPIACFTATAKHEVQEEILAFFRSEVGRELRLFAGGVERENLHFEVQTVTAPAKLERVHDLLSERLLPTGSGSAIVFRARREATEVTAEFLRAKGWAAARFHAGLNPAEKKRIQDAFLAGELRVICATNAFGMGIDKEDVRLVIHADIPGSLENYLQEAGRAGRDGQRAVCVLLYDEEDCEQQFKLQAFSELSRKDIAQILRSLRKAARRGDRDEVVITAGEILRDEEIETGIDLQDSTADTKVRTAVAWLERAGFLQRDENVTQVFQARPLVRHLAEAEARMASLELPPQERALWLAVLRELMNAGPDGSLTVDRLALLPEFANLDLRPLSPEYVSARILKILGNMARAGLLKRDLRLNAFVRHQVTDPSRARLERLLQLDRKLVDLLATEEPDPEGWMPLSLRLLNQRLCDEGLPSSMEALRSLLKSLSEDGRGFAGGQGSIELRYLSRDSYRVRVRRLWSAIAELAEKRRRVAILVLDTLLARIPANTPPQADLLVEFSLEELQEAVERDLLLRAELKDRDAALERALMYLHEQQVIVLQQGLAVFRSAMTIRLRPDAQRERYQTSDYRPLADHYRERVLQVHVMSEYARRGLEAVREALSLVLAYFALGKEEFVRRFLGAKPELLEHATTARSFQRIVTDLANPAQIRIVSAPVQGNHLILAGPGSGKTRTVVHRCAYLLRVERVRPSSVLVCCFNRNAALELRRRLADLVGNDARGVTVVTYHALAMRLLGHSFAVGDPDFPSLITDAVKLLRGETTLPGSEPDEVRDRLLAGFEHILVDEYQDIDEPQYELISALAGRTLQDADRKLSILAVGDDDQNIYSFRGTNVEFIRRFAQDYDARVHYLVENYRSTRHIIEAANQLIAANQDRMKTRRPIRIDVRRARLPAGGEFGARDPLTHGRVQVLEVGSEPEQALATLAELHRLRALGVANWSEIAVLSRTHRELGLVRALAERDGIPVRWCASRDALPPLHQIREIRRFLDQLEQRRRTLLRATNLPALLELPARAPGPNPWVRFVERLIEAWHDESGDAELPAQEAIEFIYEACAEGRRDFSYGEGVTLSTVHAAKGTEYPHVILTGAWRRQPDPAREEELRRVFYVGMTRARDTLTILDRLDPVPSPPQTAHGLARGAIISGTSRPSHLTPPSGPTTPPHPDASTLAAPLDGPAILRGRVDPATLPSASDLSPRSYTLLRFEDLYLSYAGSFEAQHPVHAALAALQPGDRLRFVAGDRNLALVNADGLPVARLSRKAEQVWRGRLDTVRDVRLVALIQRRADQDDDADRREQRRVPAWEVPLVEVTTVFP